MPELRFDYTTADWVVFAPLRKLRPHRLPLAIAADASADRPETCPFCPGNERMTPPEIYAVRSGDQWLVRVTSNKFPALRIEDDVRRVQDGPLFQHMGGCGAHEVVIESPQHTTFLAQHSVAHIRTVLETLQQRARDLMRDHRFQTVIIFKNHGPSAGTSLRHPHWQIIATPVVPRLLRLKHSEATEYFDRSGQCLYRVQLAEELSDGKRIVAANDEFVAFVPYAAHLPFETWILPRRAQTSFNHVAPEQMPPLAEILRTVLMKLYVALEDPDFNLTIDMPPRGNGETEYFQWHIRILPRLTTPAGFELGSGMSINTVLPEDAAAFLREGNHESPASGER
jgi:UDPglucose--hexose-1-phosphate uridylyltransferase